MTQLSEAPSLDWMTIEDVAEHFKVPVATVRDWRARGKGPQGVRIGRHVRYRRQDVDAWALAQQSAQRTDKEGPDFTARVRPVRRSTRRSEAGSA